MNNGFSYDRFLQVSRRTLEVNKRTYILGFGGFFVGLYALWIFAMLFGMGPAEADSSLIILGIGILAYHIGGYVLTSAAFSELQSPDSASQLLTLPATTSEKLWSAWIITFLLYSFLAFSILFGLSFLMWATTELLFGVPVNFNFMMEAVTPVDNALTYLLFNSIFLLGAVIFRGNNFLKTAFSILLFFLFIGIQGIILISLFGPETMQSFTIRPPLFLQDSAYAKLLFKTLYTVPLAALFLTFSYFRLKNRQVV